MADVETVKLKGVGGAEFTFDLPLPEQYLEQLKSGALRAADEHAIGAVDRILAESAEEEAEAAEEVVEPEGEAAGSEEEAEAAEEGAPAGNAARDEWVAYRLGQGFTEAQLADLSRDELRDLDEV